MAFLYSPPSSASGSSTYTISSKTANYTVVSTDLGAIINCSGASSFTIALTAAATLGAGFNCWIWNQTTTTGMAVTIDPNSTETIDGRTTLVLNQGEGTQIVCDGTNWQTGDKKTMRGYAEAYPATLGRPVATGQSAVALGLSYASGTDSFAAAGADNTGTYGATGTNSIAIGKQAKSTSSSSVAIGTGAIATTNFSVAIGYTAQTNNATYALALGAGAQAQGQYSTAIGLNSAGSGSVIGNAFGGSSGIGATAIGGSYASGTDSFAAAGADNTGTYGAQATSSIAIGYLSKSTGNYSAAFGAGATATGTNSVAIGSYQYGGPTASGAASVVIGQNYNLSNPSATGAGSVSIQDGSSTSSTATNSMAVQGGVTTIIGQYAYGGGDAGGTSQMSAYLYRIMTTDATATVMTTNRNTTAPPTTGSTNNQLILRNNSAYMFSIMVTARQQAAGGTASAAWKIEGLIRKEGTAATTTLVNYITTVISNVPGWSVAVSADTTNGGLAITATGAAATNIRWFAVAQTAEVTYA